MTTTQQCHDGGDHDTGYGGCDGVPGPCVLADAMSSTDTTTALPIDWNEWARLWADWKTVYAADLKPTSYRFPGINFLADDRLGTWAINGRNVELSEVTFPNLSERDEAGRLINSRHRYIGVTFHTGAGSDGSALAETFAELEQILGLTDLPEAPTDVLNAAFGIGGVGS